jgi:metallo-beta-lactamase family protein
MAVAATGIYTKNDELFDAEAQEMVKSGELRRNLQCARPITKGADSRSLHSVKGPCMIMAGNGMCTGGRIVQHLQHNLPLAETVVLIVGFQSAGSLGRKLVDGAKSVRIFGETIPVRASIHTMGGFSAHAGQTDLLNWFAVVAPSRPRIIITHGEDRARTVLAGLISARHGLKAELPGLGDVIEI